MLFAWMMYPALTTKTILYGLSECLTSAAISKSCSVVAQSGVSAPAEHPGAVRNPAWESIDGGGGRELGQTHGNAEWVSCKGCSVCRDVERAVFPGAREGIITAEL